MPPAMAMSLMVSIPVRPRPRFNALAAMGTERKNLAKTTSGAKSGGDDTAQPMLPSPTVSYLVLPCLGRSLLAENRPAG